VYTYIGDIMNFSEELRQILEDNSDKRICVVGTTCTGKTTILKSLHFGVDMDKIIFPLLTPEEEAYVFQEPWTEEIGEYMNQLVREKIKIEAGIPVFGTVVIDSDLLVFLDIDDELLKERTSLRNADFINAKNMGNKIKQEMMSSNIPYISVKVRQDDIILKK